jgi:two-component system, sensor histidine kinase
VLSSGKNKPKLSMFQWMVRSVVVSSLIAGAVTIGYMSYFKLSSLQHANQLRQYNAVVRMIESAVLFSVRGKQRALETLSFTALQFCPNASWPACAIPCPFFNSAFDPIADLTGTKTYQIATRVDPSQVATFEQFAFNFYDNDCNKSSLGVHGFGRGIFAFDSSNNVYHDVIGPTNAKHSMLVPILQDTGFSKLSSLYNLYSNSRLQLAIDVVIDCIEEVNGDVGNCTYISEILVLARQPLSIIFVPIVVPNSQHVSAFALSIHEWDTSFSSAMDERVAGLVVVISDGATTFSYSFSHGRLTAIAIGDVHNQEYNNQRYSFSVAQSFANFDDKYTISLYPTRSWFAMYSNDIPAIACGVTVGIFVFTTLMFALYDFLVRRTARHSELISDMKRQYVRFISHELRTPMNVVQMGFQVLYTEITKSLPNNTSAVSSSASIRLQHEKLLDWIDVINDILVSSQSAIAVLNDLVDYDKIDTASLSLQVEPLPVWDFVEHAVRVVAIEARAKSISLEIDLRKHCRDMQIEKGLLQLVLGDRVKLLQVIRNLVGNAIKFTPTNGKVIITGLWAKQDEDVLVSVPSFKETHKLFSYSTKVVSELSLAKQDTLNYELLGVFLLSIQDSGSGMTQLQLSQLFTEGVQFHPDQLQTSQGTGLGLWIAKSVVELHGGRLFARSGGLGHGSEFILELPLYQPLSTANQGKYCYESASSSLEDESQIGLLTESRQVEFYQNVLVVDDSAINRKMISRSLTTVGFTCYQACNGLECLQIMANSEANQHPHIHIILMDFEMPEMNGPTATSKLRAQGVRIPIIGVTGNVLQEDKDFFLSNGANHVLPKPFSARDLERVLQHISR